MLPISDVISSLSSNAANAALADWLSCKVDDTTDDVDEDKEHPWTEKAAKQTATATGKALKFIVSTPLKFGDRFNIPV
jgi:hypothetical protein